MAIQTPEKYKLIGMVIPAGTDEKGNLLVSVCYNINKYCDSFITTDSNGNRLDETIIADNYKNFVNALLKLQDEKILAVLNLNGTKSKNPFEFCFTNEFKKNTDYSVIKKDLWNNIFLSNDKFEFSKSLHSGSQVKIYNHGKPDFIYDINNDKSHENKLLKSFSAIGKTETIFKLKNIDEKESKPVINERLKLFNEFGVSTEKIAVAEKKAFAIRQQAAVQEFIDDKNKSAIVEELRNYYPYKLINTAYVEKSDRIEIDEIVHSFSQISNDPILARLMGIIVDYKIPNDEHFPKEEYFYLTSSETNDTYFLNTPIRRIGDLTSSSKSYYVIENQNKKSDYFDQTILKSEHTNILTYDMLSHLQNLENIRQRELSGQNTGDYDAKEVLTRGLLFTHDKLNEIIAPVDIIVKDKEGNPVRNAKGELQFLPNEEIHEDHFVKGVRVAVSHKKNWYPLTCRSVKLLDKKGNKIYYNGNVESCLHIDAPTAFMQDGEVKSSATPVMFEYSGELLKLKSAFAKSNAQNKLHHAADLSDNNHDDGLSKAEERFNNVLTYYPFPLIEKEENDTALYNCFYSIPDNFSKDKAPQLRFDNEYAFIVNQEYQNGYGLPLINKDGSFKNEIVNVENLELKKRTFSPAENKKTVALYHRKEVNEDLSENKILEKPSLEHLVVRSDSGEDSDQYIDERHVLPPKIDIEPAFWYGLLSNPSVDSFDFKTRANCPFADKDSYDKYVNETDEKGKSKGNKCAECGKSYCGGTQMEKYYSDRHIYPNHFFTDPSIKGFSIKLFWDKECKKQVAINTIEPSKFGGSEGVEPKSFLLRAKGAAEEAFIENHDWWEVLEVYLKKGMMIYGQLWNFYGEHKNKVENHLIEGSWWYQLENKKNEFSFNSEKSFLMEAKSNDAIEAREKYLEDRSKPKTIFLTHAVKEPLIIPEVIKLTSTPKDHKFIEHINDWLKEKEYQNYQVGINVIANRIDKNNPKESLINSSHTQVELISHFERLDAIRKIEFLKDIIPTGALELWMRKEVFEDNADQIVLSAKSETNHLPNEPVVKFSNRKNVFTLDYKIEFTNEMMSQLKNLKNIEDIDSISDVFRSLITKLNLQYDFKTTKFEEREYYLKDISKFKGFFTDEKFSDNGDVTALKKLEEFALPKITDVMMDLDKDSKFRFKVIVLNNSQPSKPDVSFAVTTIQETRSNPSSQKTISIQKGNIVTIYLKRGRLKSGKDERVGVIVDADSLYNKLFKDNELISKAGRDIVSDRFSNRSQYLQYGDIIIPEINEYKAGFDNELGIYHFLPKFDIEKQLWKFEVELDIKTADGKQLHNPFINFSLVHFQPFSINYNDKTADASLLELKNDCRISDVENSTWCYLLPERKLSVFFDKPSLFDVYGEVDLTVSFDHESLHHFNCDEDDKWIVRSNFIVTVQGSDDEIEWQPVGSWLDDGNETENDFGFHHPLLPKLLLDNEENLVRQKLKFNKWATPNNTEHSNKYSYFRVRFIEVEWFKDETWEELIERYKRESPYLLDTDVVDNEEMRIRFVELIY